MNGRNQPQQGMQLFDAEGRRLYFTEEERRAFLAAPDEPRPPFGVGAKGRRRGQSVPGRWPLWPRRRKREQERT